MKSVKTIVNERMRGMVESHLEGWSNRYAGKSKDEVEYDLNVNHDNSLEIEVIEDDLGRELSDEEKDYVSEEFVFAVLEELFG